VTLRAAVFASGSGSNFQVLTERARGVGAAGGSGAAGDGGARGPARDPVPPWEVALLISDKDDARALERARTLEVPSRVIPVVGRSLDEVGREQMAALGEAEVDLILLAGYLRLVPPDVVRAFRGRMLNVHPALLPAFGGKGMYGIHVHRAVLEAGVRVTGATVHFVDEEYDRGPILAQWPVPVLPGDTPETLAARLGRVEHRLYPAAVESLVRALATGGKPEPLPGAGGSAPAAAGEHFRLDPELPGL
jgi:phosphoribosylglycinamide formyltransferase 1